MLNNGIVRNILAIGDREVNTVDKVLKVIAVVTAIAGIIVGIVQANQKIEFLGQSYNVPFQWGTAVTWWVSGIISAIVFWALGMIVAYLEDISARLREIEHYVKYGDDIQKSPPHLGSSKASIDKLKGFKL